MTQSLNLDAFYVLVSPFSRLSWSSVASACAGTVVPALHAINKSFWDDLNEYVQFMAEMESINWEEYEGSICEVSAEPMHASLPYTNQFSQTAAEESLHPPAQVLRDGPPLSSASIPHSRPFPARKASDAVSLDVISEVISTYFRIVIGF